MTEKKLNEIKSHYFGLFDRLYNESIWFKEMVDVKFNGSLARPCDCDIHIAVEFLATIFSNGNMPSTFMYRVPVIKFNLLSFSPANCHPIK